MTALRDYQLAAVDGVLDCLASGANPLLCAPTGAGKTVMFAELAHRFAQFGQAITIVAHRMEICEQIGAALARNGITSGWILAGTTRPRQVTVAMVQTLSRRAKTIPAPDYLIVDEAHHAVSKTYRTLFNAWPVPRIGVTATPQRLDGKGLGDIYDDIVFAPSIRTLIDRGFLADYEYLGPPTVVDLKGARRVAGDWNRSDLASIVDTPSICGDAVSHYRSHLAPAPAIAFCVSIDHAEHVARSFTDAGFQAASIDGSMTSAQRRELIAALANGGLNVLTSCDLISEGVDVPVCSGAILLRPTQSLTIYLQQVGRVLRPKPDGSKAVILDHVGNYKRHGLPATERQWSLDGATTSDDVETRMCNTCYKVWLKPLPKPFVCPLMMGPGDCGIIAAPNEEKKPRALARVDGELERVTAPEQATLEIDDTPAWAGGLSITAARGREFRDVLTRATTLDHLRQIGQARGYKPGWAWHQMRERVRRALEVAHHHGVDVQVDGKRVSADWPATMPPALAAAGATIMDNAKLANRILTERSDG